MTTSRQDALDAVTVEELRATGATRWTRDGVIGAFIAETDFGTAEVVTERLHREVDRGAFGYLPQGLQAELRRETAGFLRRRTGWEVDPSDVHEMPDVIAVYQAVIRSFTRPESKIIVPTPAYMPFLLAPAMMGREIIEVEMHLDEETGLYTHDLDAIDAAFEAGGELLVFCSPHNPTGRVFTRAELQELAAVVDRHGGRVFADEIWMPLTLDAERIPYASLDSTTAGHTLTAVAASKAFNLPGLKCAQLITSHEADRERWREVGLFPMHGAANLGLAATSTAYAQGEEWLDDIRGYLRRNRDRLFDLISARLPDARLTPMEGTYLAWLDLRAYHVEGSLRDFLREQARVECTDGTECGQSWSGFVRFVYAMPLPVMEEAVERIAAALRRR